MRMATSDEIRTALGNAVVEISEGRIHEWREGDKHGKFINVKDATQAMLNLQKLDDLQDDAADEDGEKACGISFAI